MKKKKIPRPLYQVFNFDDFRWCVDNDFQVYVVPLTITTPEPQYDKYGRKISDKTYHMTGQYKIAVRRNGISTEGYDSKMVNGRKLVSKETLSESTFNSEKKAVEYLNYVYGYLRRKYG